MPVTSSCDSMLLSPQLESINVAFVGVDGIFHRRDTSLRKAVICVLIFLLLNFTTLHLCCYNF